MQQREQNLYIIQSYKTRRPQGIYNRRLKVCSHVTKFSPLRIVHPYWYNHIIYCIKIFFLEFWCNCFCHPFSLIKLSVNTFICCAIQPKNSKNIGVFYQSYVKKFLRLRFFTQLAHRVRQIQVSPLMSCMAKVPFTFTTVAIELQ